MDPVQMQLMQQAAQGQIPGIPGTQAPLTIGGQYGGAANLSAMSDPRLSPYVRPIAENAMPDISPLAPIQPMLNKFGVVGAIAGIIVVASVITLDQVLKIDDPVGAISVHMTCGIWGTLAVGIFSAQHSFLIQLAGTSSIILASALASYIIFKTIDKFYGIRVSPEEEEIGLDLAEHGMVAYSNNPTYNK